jgi:hypothetical protein
MSRRFLAAGIVALALTAIGCGGREDGDEAASQAAGEVVAGLTPAQYVKRATALCATQRQQISDELDAFERMAGRSEETVEEIATEAMEEVILSGFRSQYEGLRKLPPPSGEEDFLDLMLSKFSRSLENGEEDLARFFRVKGSGYSEFAEGTLMTEEFGIKGCGSPGRSPQAVYATF